MKQCKNCHTKLEDNALFCGKCGTRVESTNIESEKTLGKVATFKMYIIVSALLVVSVVSLAIAMIVKSNNGKSDSNVVVNTENKKTTTEKKATTEKPSSKKTTTEEKATTESIVEEVVENVTVVEFESYTVSMAIHDALGKAYDEDIYGYELDSIEVLKIDTSYAIGKYQSRTRSVAYSMELDLVDLAELTNLKELYIENDSLDNVYGISALENCKKLEVLSMFYQPIGETIQSPGSVTANFPGCKELLSVVEACPNLRYIDTKVALPKSICDEIEVMNTYIEVEENGDYNAQGAVYLTKDSYESFRGETLEDYLSDKPKTIIINDVLTEYDWSLLAQCDSLENVIYYGNADMNKFVTIKNLKRLTICGTSSGLQTETAQVINFDEVKNLSKLVALGLSNVAVDGSLKSIGDIDNLLYLGYWNCDEKLPSDLSVYKQLIAFDTTDDVGNYVKSMPNLQSLTGNIYDIASANKVGKCNELRSLDLFFGVEENTIGTKFLNGLKNVRRVSVWAYNTDTYFDWSEFAGLSNLYTLYCMSACCNIDPIAQASQLRRLHLGIQTNMMIDRSNDIYETQMDLNALCTLPHLSYFGIGMAEQFRIDYANYSALYGLRELNDNGVFIDILRNKYSDDEIERNTYKNDMFPHLN